MQNKQEQWTVLKRLLGYLKPYSLLTLLALSFLLATTVIKSIIPLVASHFIDQYLGNLSQFAKMPLPIWKNWVCLILTRHLQVLSFHD